MAALALIYIYVLNLLRTPPPFPFLHDSTKDDNMTIDISHLTTAELDDLIARAAKRRTTMLPPFPDTQPQGELQATYDPKWYITGVNNGTLLQVKDPGHGWLNYVIAPAARAVLLAHMLHHALLPQSQGNAPVPPPTPSSGGGTLH